VWDRRQKPSRRASREDPEFGKANRSIRCFLLLLARLHGPISLKFIPFNRDNSDIITLTCPFEVSIRFEHSNRTETGSILLHSLGPKLKKTERAKTFRTEIVNHFIPFAFHQCLLPPPPHDTV
jgi:hypothetical protein